MSGLDPVVNIPARTGNTDITHKLYRGLKSPRGTNLVFSPYSIERAMILVAAGAKALTYDELSSAFLLSHDLNEMLQSAKDVHEAIKTVNSDKVELNLANSAWLQDGLNLTPSYKQAVDVFLDGHVECLDFAGKPTESIDRINAWVDNKTKGMLNEASPAGPHIGLTILKLISAMYFNGKWATAFDPKNTCQMPFHHTTTSKEGVWEQTDMMVAKKLPVRYAAFSRFTVAALPYDGNRLEMVIVLPNHAGYSGDPSAKLTVVEDDLFTGARVELDWLLDALKPVQADVYLPKFSISWSEELLDTLHSMGLKSLFDPTMCNLSGMVDIAQVHVSSVRHQAKIEVEESGTKAATVVDVVKTCSMILPEEPATFKCDHPFLFFVRDTSTGTILLAGRVCDPLPVS